MKEKEKTPQKRVAIIPRLKTFIFDRNTTQQNMDEHVNKWIDEATFRGESPMPGKCFSNHFTGEIIYVIVHHIKKEIPEEFNKLV